MSKTATALCLGVTLVATNASAMDWSAKGEIAQAVELSDNQFLKTMFAGGSLGSYSTVATNLEGRTPTTKFDFDSDASYRKYWGPGVSGLQSEYLSYGVRAHYERSGKTVFDKAYLDVGFSQQSAALAVFNTLGVNANVSGFLNQTTVKGGLDRALTNQDSVSVSVRSTYTNYDVSNAGIPFTDTIAIGAWKHQLNASTTILGIGELEQISYENVFGTNVWIVRNLAGLDIKLSPVLKLRMAAGPAYVSTIDGFGALAVPGVPSISQSNAYGDFVYNFLLTYNLFKTTNLVLDSSRSVAPSIIGSILTRSNVRVGLLHDINALSSLSFYADYTRLQSPATTDFLTATDRVFDPTYQNVDRAGLLSLRSSLYHRWQCAIRSDQRPPVEYRSGAGRLQQHPARAIEDLYIVGTRYLTDFPVHGTCASDTVTISFMEHHGLHACECL